jgi:hypothetical protein
MEWNVDEPLTEQDLQAIDAAFQAATSSFRKKKQRRTPDAVVSDPPMAVRRLPSSLLALQNPNPLLSPCQGTHIIIFMVTECLLFFLLFGYSERWGQGKRLLSLSIYFVLFYEAVNERTRYPALKFGGRIVYSRTATEVEKAAEELLKNLEAEKRESGQVVLGFDIEWRPSFRRG